MKSNSTQLEHASRSRSSNIILELLAERVRCAKSHSEYLLPFQWVLIHLFLYFHHGLIDTATRVELPKTEPICDGPPPRWTRRSSLRYRYRAAIIVLRCEQKAFPVWFSWWCKSSPLSDMWLFTLGIGEAQLRTVTENAWPQPFSCVNISPLRYGFFCVGARAIRYGVIIAAEFIWSFWMTLQFLSY